MSKEKSKLTAKERLNLLFDQDTFKEIGRTVYSHGKIVGVTTAFGTIDNTPCYAFSQDSLASSGAVDKAHAEKIAKLYRLAVKTGTPVVGIYDSLGGNLEEGVTVMEAYSHIISTISSVSGVVPQISIILGNCAGAMAVAACSADIVVASSDAEIFMTHPLQSEKGQSAKEAYNNGIVSNLCEDEETAIEKAKDLIAYLPKNNLEQPPMFEFTENNTSPLPEDCADSILASSATVDYESKSILYSGYGENCEVSFATVGGVPVGTISISNALGQEECSKVSRLISLCDCFNIPVITFMDCQGFNFGESKDGIALREIAKLSHMINDSTTAKIFLATGKAYGPAYIAFSGSADIKLAFPNAVISPLAPKTAAVILADDKITAEKPREQVLDEFIKNNLSATKLAEDGIIDDVINPANVREEIVDAVSMLYDKRVSRIPKKHSNIPM